MKVNKRHHLAGCVLGMLAWASTAPAAGTVAVGETHPERLLEETDAGRLLLPSDTVVDRSGRVWVVDSGRHRIAVFGPQGEFLMAIGERGNGNGQFRDPLGIGTDREGNVYIADAGNRRIQVLSGDGKWQRTIPAVDGNGAFRPVDVGVGADGGIYVTANDRHRVVRFSREGRLLGSWGGEGLGEGEFRYPATIAVRDEWVYVVDVLNTRVQIFDLEGRFRYQIGEWGVRPGQLFRPKGIALDDKGWVYVSDSYMESVQVFDSGFEFRHVIGAAGKVQKFSAPTGLAIDKTARLYVCEMLGNRVAVLQLR